MSLKRGLERQSCDFCFQRKIKCDRTSRAREGHDLCSQCDLRRRPCTLDSDDVRAHRRRQIRLNSATLLESSLNIRGQGEDMLALSSQAAVPATLNSDTNTDSSWTDLELELHPESISFLNEVFMQDFALSESIANIPDRSDASLQNVNEITEVAIAKKRPYEIQGIDFSTLERALAAYFDFASLVLPVIHRDALMADYESRQSSSALIFAVACRGCPFIPVSEKWSLQQRFASGFRLAFLEAQNSAAAQQTVRLDDLEALALMDGFAYESDENTATALHSQLGALFLTHQSLVLMTLQYQICCPPTLEGAAERKALLLWHIYGLDAFYCLDHGVMSRIPEEDMEVAKPPESFTGQETGSYLDTMLSLAAIARRITRTIYSSAAKRKGVKLQEVEDLYEQLSKWGEGSCPLRLRFTGNLNSDTADRDTMNKTLLHRTVISLLELHCYMEVERCLDIGIQERTSAEGEALELRVGYETLNAANRILKTVQYMEAIKDRGKRMKMQNRYSLADLSPNILRNVCCGASNWFCSHAQRLLQQQGRGSKVLSRQRAQDYMEKAAKLRDTATTAVSHMDTAHRVKQVNERLNDLKELVEQS